jgi:hypothetical protein
MYPAVSNLSVSECWNAPNMDLFFALAGLGDVVGSLHPHERVHSYAEGFFDAERHVSGEVGPAVQQA